MALTKKIKNKVKEMLKDNNISFDDFYNYLSENELLDENFINSEDTIKMYVNEMINKGVQVSHILDTIENNPSKEDLYFIWLGNSMNTPEPINNKKDLYEWVISSYTQENI